MGLKIDIVGGDTAASSRVDASGSVQHVVTGAERDTFKIGDDRLKGAVATYFGQRPTDVFVCSPTPWNDLYKTYGWEQVSMLLTVRSAEITSVDSKPVLVATKEGSNEFDETAEFDASLSETVTNTATIGWNTGGALSIEQAVEIGVKVKGLVGFKETTKLAYSQNWGVNGTQSQVTAVGSSSKMNVPLKPGKSILAELSASRGSIGVRVVYSASLTGSLAVNYKSPFKGHHFWALGIGDVMAAGGLSNEVVTTEDIDLDYYSNSKITIKTPDGSVMQELANAAAPGPT